MWSYDASHGVHSGHPDNAKEQLAKYKDQVEQLIAERDKYSTTVNGAESQLNIERSAQKQLAEQVKALESENTRLKEDLAFFESLLPNATGPLGISIRRLKIDQVAPNQIRYRLLIMQGGKGDRGKNGSDAKPECGFEPRAFDARLGDPHEAQHHWQGDEQSGPTAARAAENYGDKA